MLECYADDHEYRLIRNLLRNYDPRLRPLMNASHALNVTLGVALSQIIDVVSKSSTSLSQHNYISILYLLLISFKPHWLDYVICYISSAQFMLILAKSDNR